MKSIVFLMKESDPNKDAGGEDNDDDEFGFGDVSHNIDSLEYSIFLTHFFSLIFSFLYFFSFFFGRAR